MGLRLMNINKSFGIGIGSPRKKVLDNVSLEIHDGEMVAIVGRRGSGKTTLMNIMTGLNRPDSGRYMIDGKLVGLGRTFQMANFRAKKCGIITRKPLLVPDQTLFDNITMPLNHRFMTRKKKLKRAREVLRGLGLKGKGRFCPTEFSLHDQQKICAGRAMIAEPKYIFADEPTGGLSSADVDRYMDFLEVLNSAGYTIIVFTYSKRVAAHCHRMIPVTGEDLPEVSEADKDDFAEVRVPDEEPEEIPEPEQEEPDEIEASPEVHEILGGDEPVDEEEALRLEEQAYLMDSVEEAEEPEVSDAEPEELPEPVKPARAKGTRTRKSTKKTPSQE